MVDFGYIDLVHFAESAGFEDVHVTVEASVRRRPPRSWHSFLAFTPNPNARTMGETIDERLTGTQRAVLHERLRPLVEAGAGVERQIMAYVRARKG